MERFLENYNFSPILDLWSYFRSGLTQCLNLISLMVLCVEFYYFQKLSTFSLSIPFALWKHFLHFAGCHWGTEIPAAQIWSSHTFIHIVLQERPSIIKSGGTITQQWGSDMQHGTGMPSLAVGGRYHLATMAWAPICPPVCTRRQNSQKYFSNT